MSFVLAEFGERKKATTAALPLPADCAILCKTGGHQPCNKTPLDLLDEQASKELEQLLAVIHSQTLSAAAKLEEVGRLLASMSVMPLGGPN